MYRKNYIPANANLENDMSIHWHEDVEFIYVSSGYTVYRLNDGIVRINAGEGIFVNSNQLHLIVPGDEDCVLHCLIFHPRIIGNSEYMYKKYVSPVTGNKKYPYLMLSEQVEWQAKIFEIMAGMEAYYFAENALKAYDAIYRLWELLYDNMEKDPVNHTPSNENLEIVKKMITFISINYAKKISLADICQAGNVGKTKGTELFSKFTNQTPIEYLNNFRIEKSTHLLRETDKTITEIAYEVGFSDNSHYTRCFRERIGLSPKQYRAGFRYDDA